MIMKHIKRFFGIQTKEDAEPVAVAAPTAAAAHVAAVENKPDPASVAMASDADRMVPRYEAAMEAVEKAAEAAEAVVKAKVTRKPRAPKADKPVKAATSAKAPKKTKA
jgi:mannose-1-phosphate guanylyltransferase